MALVLTVSNPFGGYRRGDQIVDTKTIKDVLASEHRSDVVKTSKPDTPAPSAKPAAD